MNPSPVLRIGRYSIVKQLGEGATSNVYLGIQDETFAAVAIKQLRKGCQSPLHKAMFTTEIELGRKMMHKNIAHVIDADLNEKSGAYLVMEYINGTSLDHHEKVETLLPIKTVLSVIEQVATALKYAAELGIVHRDVKPGNIILMPNGQIKLADFGCAIPVSKMGQVVAGSLAYMSPEQLEGEALDQQADIYSLGAVLYRLLTGKKTFVADNAFDARIAILNFTITPVETYRKGLPAQLILVINRALQKNAEDRYANWDEFMTAFGNAAHFIRMSGADIDSYRGFSSSTQAVLSDYLSADRAFSRSGFSRSTMLN